MITKGIFFLLLVSSPALWALELQSESQEIKALTARTAVHATYNYCTPNTLTCRTLVLLKDNSSKNKVADFYENFISAERKVAATGYFVRNEDGTYRNYLDESFDGQVNVNLIHDENRRLEVTFDAEGFPTIHKYVLKHMGTPLYAEGDLKYGPHEATIEGFQYNSNDPNFKKPIRVVYRLQSVAKP